MLTSGAFTSPYYNLFYRTTSPQGAWNVINRVTSPYTVTGLTNGEEYDFYVLAHNSIGERQSNQVTAQPTRFQFRGAQFIPGSTQGELSAGSGLGTNPNAQHTNVSMLSEVPLEDASYPAFTYDVAVPEAPIENPTPTAGFNQQPSAQLTPSGRYKVYVNSQGNILSGVGQ
jgi:hypothetical protein